MDSKNEGQMGWPSNVTMRVMGKKRMTHLLKIKKLKESNLNRAPSLTEGVLSRALLPRAKT